jgi:hypothetical protein
MLRQILKLITNNFTSKVKYTRYLGRWNIDYCPKKTNTKIDLANEDHCGPCGQYIISKNEKLNIIQNTHNKTNIK